MRTTTEEAQRTACRGRTSASARGVMLTLFAIFATSLTATSQPARSAPFGTFEERLEAAFVELGKKKLSSLAGVAHRGGPIVVREFGAAAADQVPASETQVDINSITKTVTAAMTMKLVEQGKVGLEETLGEIFSAVPKDKADITVFQLLTHSAGLVDSVGPDEERLGKPEFMQRLFGSKLRWEPGKRYGYSNAGYSMLAAIIEARSGRSYEDYLQQDVLAGLGLKNTGYMAVYDDKRSLRTTSGGTIMQASWGGHEPFWNLLGNGGMISTAADFITFRLAYRSGAIAPSALVEESQRKQVPENARGSSHYGFGLVVQDHARLGRIYWHDGGNDIYSAIWVDLPEQDDIIFTAAVNDGDDDATAVLRVILKHLYGADGF